MVPIRVVAVAVLAHLGLLVSPAMSDPLTFFDGGWQNFARYTMPSDTGVTTAPVVYDFNNPTPANHDEVMVYLRLDSAAFGQQEAAAAMQLGGFTPQDLLIPGLQGILGDDVTLPAVGWKAGAVAAPENPATAGETLKLEIWHRNYLPGLNGVYDYEDTPSVGDHASYQIFTPLTSGADPINSPRDVVLAYNFWGRLAGPDSMGIGNNTVGHPDWTFTFNANTYTFRQLNWYSRDSSQIGQPVPEPTSLAIWLLLGVVGIVYGWRRRNRMRRVMNPTASGPAALEIP